MRGQNKAADIALLRRPHQKWFDYYVKGNGRAAAARPYQGVETLTQTCPESTPLGRALLRQGLGARLQGRDPLRRGGGEDDLANRGRSGDRQHLRPDLGGGACAQASGGRPARHRHLPAAGRDRRGLHADGLADRGRRLQADRRQLAGRRAPARRRPRRQGDPGRPRPLAARRPIPASSSRSSSSTRTAGTSRRATSPSSSCCPTTPPYGRVLERPAAGPR